MAKLFLFLLEEGETSRKKSCRRRTSKISASGVPHVGGVIESVVSCVFDDHLAVQSDLPYPVLFYPDPSPSGRKSLVADLQHMACIHTVCVFDYPVPSPIRIFSWKTDVCG